MSTAAQLVAEARSVADSIPEDAPGVWQLLRELKGILRDLSVAVAETIPVADLAAAQRARAAHATWAEGPPAQPAAVLRLLAEDETRRPTRGALALTSDPRRTLDQAKEAH